MEEDIAVLFGRASGAAHMNKVMRDYEENDRMSKYRPVGDKVVIQPEKFDRKTPGGLHLPEIAHKTFICRGEVLAVGRGLRLQDGGLAPLEIKAGDVVVFDRRIGESLEEGKPDGLRVLREHEILAVVQE